MRPKAFKRAGAKILGLWMYSGLEEFNLEHIGVLSKWFEAFGGLGCTNS